MSIFSKTFLGAYGAVWRMATPILRRHERLREGFEQRLLPPDWPFEKGLAPAVPPLPIVPQPLGVSAPLALHPAFAGISAPRIWIQAASGGEARLVHTLVDALANMPHAVPLTLVCTTCTRQGLDVLKGVQNHLVAHNTTLCVVPAYMPLDSPSRMAEAMQRVAPSAVVLLETELWPGLMAAARGANLPVLVLNARMTEKSLAGYRWLSPFWQEHCPTRVLAVSVEDAARFAALFGASNVGVMPNMKFASVLTPHFLTPSPFAGMEGATPLPRIGLASVREEEEQLLLPVMHKLLADSVNEAPLLLAIAPRHMHRVSAWCDNLTGAGIAFVRRSELLARVEKGDSQAHHEGNSNPPALRVLLWDTFGDLACLYAHLDAVFVGGSLAPLGGQNFLEPLGHGLVPCIGPHWKNFHWVGRELVAEGLVREVQNASALAPALLEQAAEATAPKAQTVRDRFSAWLTPRKSGGEVAAQAVLDVVQKSRS